MALKPGDHTAPRAARRDAPPAPDTIAVTPAPVLEVAVLSVELVTNGAWNLSSSRSRQTAR